MKRSKVSNTRSSAGNTRAIDAGRLAAVRGGAGLDIAIDVVPPDEPVMTQQHNETLVRG